MNIFQAQKFKGLILLPICILGIFAISNKVFAGTETIRIYSSSYDGMVAHASSSWSGAHDASTGSFLRTDQYYDYALTQYSDSLYNIYKTYLVFDTSALPDNAVITDATLGVYVAGKFAHEDDGHDFIRVVPVTPASSTALTYSDYDNFASTTLSVDKDITSVLTNNQYNTFPLNSDGKSLISKNGYTTLGLREGHDLDNFPITNINNRYSYAAVLLNEQDGAGTSSDPYIEITYYVPQTVKIYSSSYDGMVAYASSDWSQAQGASTGSFVRTDQYYDYALTQYSDSQFFIYRTYLVFDTSDLPDNAVITDSTLGVYVSGKFTHENDGNDFIRVVPVTPASSTALTYSDYGNFASTTLSVDKDISSELTSSQYNTFALNSDGKSLISKTGYTTFGLREGHDVKNDPIANYNNTYSYAAVLLSEQDGAGTSSDPYIEITYY